MSHLLDEVLAQAANEVARTVTLSPESVAVLLFGTGFIERRASWLDREEFPLDEVTAEDWDKIEEIVANMVYEVYNPVATRIVGEIASFGLSIPPDGWLVCDGSYVPIADYPALFAAIGENFGFSVGGNFVLPDMRFRSPVGMGELDYDPDFGIGIGEKLGSAEIGLSTTHIPAHNHTLQRITGSGAQTGYNAVTGASFLPITQVTGNTGSGTPFDIIQPVIGLLACIYAGE